MKVLAEIKTSKIQTTITTESRWNTYDFFQKYSIWIGQEHSHRGTEADFCEVSRR